MNISNCLRPALILSAAFCVTLAAHAAGAATATTTTATASIEQGDRLWAANKLEEAQLRFQEAVKSDPNSVDAKMKLAGIQITLLNYSGAIMTYRDALTIDSKNARAWMGMGMCYLHSGSREMARGAFEEALRADPSRKQQIEPVLAELDTKIEAKRAQMAADMAAGMPEDSNHKGKTARPTSKSSGQPAQAIK
jgi:Tfp pilus assembly protein PilF